MPIVIRCATALLWVLMTQAAHSQIRLPALSTPLLTQPLQNTHQALQQTESRTLDSLSGLRQLEITQLVRGHRSTLELDPDGQLIVRNEIVALAPGDAAVARALAAGFTIAREQNLDSVDLRVLVWRVPSALTTKHALRQLREADPGGTYDYNHIYLGSGAIGLAEAPPAVAATTDAVPAAATRSDRRIGLIDSGVDTNHPVFAAASIEHWGCDGKSVPAAHGTAVASLLIGHADLFRGVQPGAALYAADVYCGLATGGAVDALLAAFAWMAEEKVPVINVSLVGPKNSMLQAVIARLVAGGFTIVAAVGNDGPAAPPLYPASYPNVIGVTAVDARHHVLIEAACGPQVMFAAIGADTAAAGIHGDYAAVRGTSFAAPIVAGLMAADLNNPDSRHRLDVLAALQLQAVDLGPVGRDLTYGFGLVGAQFRTDPAALKQP